MFKTGDIFFVMNKKNMISKVISWAMSSNWSHSGIVYEMAKLNTYTLETNDFCVTHGTMEDYVTDLEHSMEVYRPKSIDENNACMAAIQTRAMLYGKMYGYLQLLSLGIRRLFMKFQIKIKNFIRTSVVCCHVVGYFYKNLGKTFISKLDSEGFDTEELYQWIKKSDEFELIYKKH